MKILLVSLFLPRQQANHAGGRYVFEILRQLAKHHQVTLATRYEAGEEGELEALRPWCREIHAQSYPAFAQRGVVEKAQLIGSYLTFSRFADTLIRDGDFDLIQVEWVETAFLIGRHSTPMLLDAHDVMTKPAARRWREARGLGRVMAGVKYLLTRSVERWIVGRFDAVLTVSDFDRGYLEAMAVKTRVRTVPIPAGLDLTERAFLPVPGTILFLASYRHHRTNIDSALWLAQEVLPRVREQVPEARLILAGYGPPAELLQLAEADPCITVPGFVEDLDRCYKEAALFAAPILTGGGMIVKILDALAAGRPVVTTPFGNEGVGAESGRDLLVVDTAKDFADALVHLLRSPELAERLGAEGKAFVARRYSPAVLLAQLESVYAEVVS
ncbi:MAG: glycosyl transferase family 1 [Deltaproteobacteria bacterium HGW-Deltaproteobacteria-4]|nr:MAG: glycosyl transferase family 1 [Deltaproteobacteria bacterium HGW-Deltaproteobacteria-4]